MPETKYLIYLTKCLAYGEVTIFMNNIENIPACLKIYKIMMIKNRNKVLDKFM